MSRLPVAAALSTALLAPLAAQKVKDLVGVERCKPGLVPPMVLDRIVDPERNLYPPKLLLNMKLQFHESVPAEVWLERGKRETLFKIYAKPPMKRTQFITPGLLNLELEYDKRHKREHRWEIKETQGRMIMYSHSGTLLRLRRGQVCFLDLNHDGAFGGLQDGYVIRERRTRQWVKPGKDLKVFLMEEAWPVDDGQVWFDVDTAGFSVVVTTKKPDYTVERRKDYQKGLEYLNKLRKLLGHEPVTLDDSLVEPCEKHSLYCALNGSTHDEEKGMPGYTPEGARAGKVSELTPARSMVEAVHSFSATFFHRIRMLSPGLDKVGMGLVNGRATLDAGTHFRSKEFEPYAWPHDGATDVAVTWMSGEKPNPLGGEKGLTVEVARTYGYPITLTFPSWLVKDVKVSLVGGDGKELELVVSTPEDPSVREHPGNLNTVFFMSKGRLSAKTTYTATVNCTFKGEPFKKEWKFTTR